MKPLIARHGLVRILILTSIPALAFIAYYPFSPAARQARNLAAAREHATLLTPKIDADPRFAHIRLGGYTGGGGMFWVIGNVSSQEDLAALRQFVVESGPPVETRWSVEVSSLPPEEAGSSNPLLDDAARSRGDDAPNGP